MHNRSIPEPLLRIPEATATRNIWLRTGVLLDGVSAQPVRNAHIVYNSERVVFVGDASSSPPPTVLNAGQFEPDVSLPEYTLLPCLIEAHAHLFLEGGELDPAKRAARHRESRDELLESAQVRMTRLARLGIAAIRDAGDKDGVGLALSKMVRARRGVTPYIDSPGAAIHRRGRYGSFMAEPLEQFASIRHCVETRVSEGADRIKLIATGIINFEKGAVTSAPQMSAADVAGFVEAAAAFGKQTFAHASGDTGIQCVIDGRVDTVEHGFFVRPDQLAAMRDRNIGWVPTFAPVQTQVDHARELDWSDEVVSRLRRILDDHAASLVRAHQLDVRIIAGSDAGSLGVAHGIGLLRELELMEQAGLPSIDVVNAATGHSSERLSFRQNVGQIKPGFLSRFMLTRHSPLETVSNLREERCVIFDNAVFYADETLDTSGL